MAYRKKEKPILFNDKQMRQFVADGYVIFKPDVPGEVHKLVHEKLKFMEEEEFNCGNNVLPRVPEMDRVLNSPEVRGALISVLGSGYIEHPNRHSHFIPPGREPVPVAQKCHQDGYTPLARQRQHYPRFARIMYYPQDSPVEIGPTHLIPGSYGHKLLPEEDRQKAVPIAGEAGTVCISHFDIGHGAGINKINKPRAMIKFIYARAEEPSDPSWDCQDRAWRNPEQFETPHNLNLMWSHIWDWLCGKKDRYESFRASNADSMKGALETLNANDLDTRISAMHSIATSVDLSAIPTLIERLNCDLQWERLTAIYTLGALGQPAVDPLVTALKDSANGEAGDPTNEIWNENSILMNDASFALAAIGEPSLDSLIGLLDDSSEWVRINAAFALGEMDSAAAKAVPALTRCLDDESHCVVRTATEALGTIKQNSEQFIPSLGRLLKGGRPEWQTIIRRDWSPYDQVRVNAALAFARLGKDASSAEEILIDKLADPNGYVAAFVLDALRRIGTPLAMESAMEYLMSRRWDESIRIGRLY